MQFPVSIPWDASPFTKQEIITVLNNVKDSGVMLHQHSLVLFAPYERVFEYQQAVRDAGYTNDYVLMFERDLHPNYIEPNRLATGNCLWILLAFKGGGGPTQWNFDIHGEDRFLKVNIKGVLGCMYPLR